MPDSLSAKKRVRQNERSRQRNKSIKSQIKTARKMVIEAIEEEKSTAELEELKTKAITLIDRAVSKNVFHKNKAARLKSRLEKQVQKAIQ
ncbi:MAG: 30S ribosomal protein S20 [bacterium]